MYYMIHATDHPDTPMLMSRAYRKAVTPKETSELRSREGTRCIVRAAEGREEYPKKGPHRTQLRGKLSGEFWRKEGARGLKE